MKIRSIEIYRVCIDLEYPFTIATGSTTSIDSIIIKIVDNKGNVGWGEAAPHPVILGETSKSIIACLDLLAPHLIGKDPRKIESIINLMDIIIQHNTAAKAAIDIAVHDLVSKALGEPLWRLLGGAKNIVETDFTIGIRPKDAVVKEILNSLKEGFKAVKLKVGRNPDEDIEMIKSVRKAVGNEVRLRIDANQGWTRQQAIYALRKIVEYNIEFVEQPLPAFDISGLAALRRAIPIPLMVDESVHQPEDVIRIVKEDAADYINIKLMKSGGIQKASRIAAIAEATGVECMVGSMIETDLGITAAVHFAAATKNVKFGDLDIGFSLRPRDRLIKKGGAKFNEGYVIPPDEPGLGIQDLKEELLQGPIKVYNKKW